MVYREPRPRGLKDAHSPSFVAAALGSGNEQMLQNRRAARQTWGCHQKALSFIAVGGGRALFLGFRPIGSHESSPGDTALLQVEGIPRSPVPLMNTGVAEELRGRKVGKQMIDKISSDGEGAKLNVQGGIRETTTPRKGSGKRLLSRLFFANRANGVTLPRCE